MPPSIRKLTGRLGAAVEGVDLTAPPDRRPSAQIAGEVSHRTSVLEVAA